MIKLVNTILIGLLLVKTRTFIEYTAILFPEYTKNFFTCSPSPSEKSYMNFSD